MWTSWVHFKVIQSDCDEFQTGSNDSVWVRTKSKDKESIENAAKHKMMLGFGVEIEIESYSVEWFTQW